MFEIVHVEDDKQLEAVRGLVLEYAAFLRFDLSFQGFQEELDNLPGEYAPPDGRLMLATEAGEAAGCVALRKIEGDVCEMKRLFVRERYRGSGLGRTLAEVIVREARSAGYRRMRLDTVAALVEAIGLYRSLGFRKIDAYRYNPIEGASFWELDLYVSGPTVEYERG